MHVYLLKRDLDLSTLILQESEVSEVKWISITKLYQAWKDQDPTIVPCEIDSPYTKKLMQILQPNS
jgi:hypothetical protein